MSRRLVGRNGDCWRRWVSGETQESIAERNGISQQRVSQIIKEVRESIPAEVRADLILKELDFLNQCRLSAMDLAEADLPPAYSDGRPIKDTDENGQEITVRDASGRLSALTVAVRVHERHCKLMGLDAPTKVESKTDVTLTQAESEASAALAAQAAARLAGDDEPAQYEPGRDYGFPEDGEPGQ